MKINNSELARHAEAAGMTYFMGSSCVRCGSQWRYVKGAKACVQCSRARCKTFRNENADMMLAFQKDWRQRNAEHHNTWRKLNSVFGAKPLIKYGDEPQKDSIE